MNENQLKKAINNLLEDAWKDFEKEFDDRLKFRPSSENNRKLFGGIKGHSMCPCGSSLKYRFCCSDRVDVLIEALSKAEYAGSEDTTQDQSELPWSFDLSPVFRIHVDFEEKDDVLIKGIIETHPTVVDHLYLISCERLAVDRSYSPYARSMYDLMEKVDEGVGTTMEELAENTTPLTDKEREIFIHHTTMVPAARDMMRKDKVRLLSNNTFLLGR